MRFRICASIVAGCGVALAWSAVADAPSAFEWREAERARALLHEERITRLARERFGELDTRLQLAYERAQIREAQAALAANEPPPVRTGLRMEAYVSAIDDSPQPFWRYLPPDWRSDKRSPLLVFLHGYDPFISLVRAPYFQASLTNIAARAGACVVVPFGRSNTDFQGIGEQDVAIVIDEMIRRYGCDSERVVLYGFSMGGLGAWCMGARMPHRFNALLILSGRGDFYAWHRLTPDELPPWQRRLVEMQFASAWVGQMTRTPLLALHGMQDEQVSFRQGRAIFEQVRPHNRYARFMALPDAGHLIHESIEEDPRVHAWLLQALEKRYPKSPVGRVRPGESGSRLQDAMLRPFLFVGAGTNELVAAEQRLRLRADEWTRFSQGRPRTVLETRLQPARAALFNLFLFGEPENSLLIRRVLEAGGVTIEAEQFQIAGRRLPRTGHGLWFTGVNPFNPDRIAVVQSGIPWGEHLPDNHRYDRIPDLIVYQAEADRFGVNLAIAAGFLNDTGQPVWYDPPVTPAIRAPAPIPFREQEVYTPEHMEPDS